ncbi:hypothetical protein E2C01_100475 [Portunus trituberculatus]|uniref:Uncharacterized protein n=1 Tax=Portunus trituberculatus TaxID=210409 RepID=A0A5B7KHN2_PORTR|nr:hypothetical protein [Portunus trituberculatus]
MEIKKRWAAVSTTTLPGNSDSSPPNSRQQPGTSLWAPGTKLSARTGCDAFLRFPIPGEEISISEVAGEVLFMEEMLHRVSRLGTLCMTC